MIKRTIILLLTLLLFHQTYLTRAIENPIIKNGSFELIENNGIDSWAENKWDTSSGVTQFIIDKTISCNGKNSILIVNNKPNDARLSQVINVEGDSLYKISCWIKTEDVGANGKGANISVEGILDTSTDIKGSTVGFKNIILYGRTGAGQKTLKLTIGLGGYSNINSGKAWFDDVEIQKIEKAPIGIVPVKLYTGDALNNNLNSVKKGFDNKLFYLFFAFIIICILIFILYSKAGKIGISNNENKSSNLLKEKINTTNKITDKYLFIILLLGLLLRIVLALMTKGHPIDMGCFKAWAFSAANNLFNFYNPNNFSDYPPFYIYVLFLLGKLISFLHMGVSQIGQNLIIKLPSIICDLASAYMLYRLSEKHLSRRWRLIISAIFIFNPLIIINSSVWGQVDSFFTLFVIAALYFIYSENLIMSSVVFTLSILIKPQGIIFLPVLFFELIYKKSIKTFILSFIAALATFIIIILPFALNHELLWIFKLYIKTISEYPYATLNAYNLFAFLGGNWGSSSSSVSVFGFHTILSYKTTGFLFIVVISLYTALLYYKDKGKVNGKLLAPLSSVILIFGVFVLASGMHERYMYPAVALIILVFILTKDIRFFTLLIIISTTGFINTYQVYDLSLRGIYQVPAGDYLLKIISLINIFTLFYLIKLSYEIIFKRMYQKNK